MACVQHRLLGHRSLSTSEASAPTPIGSQRRCARRCEGLSAWRAYAFPGSRRTHPPPCPPADTCVRTCGHQLPGESCEAPRAERVACRAGRAAAHHGGRAAGWTQARHSTCKSLLDKSLVSDPVRLASDPLLSSVTGSYVGRRRPALTLECGTPAEGELSYMRQPRVETGDARERWLKRVVALGGRTLGAGGNRVASMGAGT